MPLLANNAATKLAASISAADTALSVLAGTGGVFPAGGSDWFPVTLIKPNGEYEICHCSSRSGDILTVVRGREGTAAKAFSAGDRVELRLTSETLNAMLTAATNAAKLTFTPVQQGGGANQGANKVYIGWGTDNQLRAQVDSTDLGYFWTTRNFNPASYLPLTGGTITGNLTFSNTALTIQHWDTDNGINRYIHANGGSIGFLNSGAGWAAYSANNGDWVASGNVGAYSDRKHKKDIETIENALELVERLRGVRYVNRRTEEKCVGVIAQEVQEVLPEVVGTSPDGLYVDYGKIVGPLIEAVKALAARVKKLEGRE